MTDNLLRERVLTIVSLIAQYIMEERGFSSDDDLIQELLAIGFEAEEIDAAFHWMENLTLKQRGEAVVFPTLTAERIFSPDEMRIMAPEARGFLIRLRTMGIIDDHLQEEIIDRAMMEVDSAVSLQEIKSIAALTLFTHSHDEWRREVDCIIDDDWSRLYN